MYKQKWIVEEIWNLALALHNTGWSSTKNGKRVIYISSEADF